MAARGPRGIKETRVRIGDLDLNVAAVSGLANARRLLDELRRGWREVHFVEVV